MPTVIAMKVSGSMIELRDKEFIHTWMEPNMRASGQKINNTVKADRCGLMGQNTWENIYTENNTERESSNGPTGLVMKENFQTTILKVTECIIGMMIDNILELGKTIRCMEEAYSHGPMDKNMMVNMQMINKRATEYFIGLTGKFIKACGKKDNNMAKEC